MAVLSFKSGYNRALLESQHAKEYGMVWLDTFLDKLIVPMDQGVLGSGGGSNSDDTVILLSPVSILKVIRNFNFVVRQGNQHHTMTMGTTGHG